jgi:hypothetical protein
VTFAQKCLKRQLSTILAISVTDFVSQRLASYGRPDWPSKPSETHLTQRTPAMKTSLRTVACFALITLVANTANAGNGHQNSSHNKSSSYKTSHNSSHISSNYNKGSYNNFNFHKTYKSYPSQYCAPVYQPAPCYTPAPVYVPACEPVYVEPVCEPTYVEPTYCEPVAYPVCEPTYVEPTYCPPVYVEPAPCYTPSYPTHYGHSYPSVGNYIKHQVKSHIQNKYPTNNHHPVKMSYPVKSQNISKMMSNTNFKGNSMKRK